MYYNLLNAENEDYFILNPNNGRLQLKTSLLQDPNLAEAYDVSEKTLCVDKKFQNTYNFVFLLIFALV